MLTFSTHRLRMCHWCNLVFGHVCLLVVIGFLELQKTVFMDLV